MCADAVRIRVRQNEPVHVAIRNVSAHKSDNKFQGVTSIITFPNFHKWREFTVLAGR